MKHQRYARKTEAKDDKLPAIRRKNQVLSCDGIVVAKSHTDKTRLAADGSAVGITIMDNYSGMLMLFPTASAVMNKYWFCLKFFVGPGWTAKPNIIVKSDADTAITGAVTQLGWHTEPSLANTWPHNARLERAHETLKSVQRASIL